ncbi:MAG: acyl dehydratase [Starkeya sp.]|nr:acyl dehydratase [Starkeya sp.]
MTVGATTLLSPAGALPPGLYGYDDLSEGAFFLTSGVTVTEAHIVGYAGISGDLFDVHMDDAFAREQGFPGRIAHGLLGLALIDGLKTRCPVRLQGVATLSWNWSFKAPILIGDRITARFDVHAKRQTRRADRGIVTFNVNVVNQNGEVVQEGQTLLMMGGRKASDAASA